jgi:predicted DNA-binding transcriptional regulator YafY
MKLNAFVVGLHARRDDYRCFRLDRCLNINLTDRRFSESADRSLADFLRKVKQ